MAGTLMIRQLEAKMQRVKVICRLMKKWQVYYPATEQLGDHHFLFIDAEENAIEAKVDKHTFALLKSTFDEGKVYMLTNFKVINSQTLHRVVKKTIMIQFTKYTKAKAMPEVQPPLPLYYFDFVQFEDLSTSGLQEKKIVDVIGCLVSAGPTQIVGEKESRVRNIEIANERDARIYITLWGNFVNALDLETLAKQSATHPIVIVFSSMELRDDKFRGIGLKTVSATRFYHDRTIPHILEFEQRLGQRYAPISFTATEEHQSLTMQTMQQTEQLSLAELLAQDFSINKATNYKCVAEIIGLDDNLQWYYRGCSKCKMSIKSIEKGRKCPSCPTDVTMAAECYKILAQVADNTASTVFTLMGNVAEQIIGFPAEKLAKDEDSDSEDLPEKIKAIVHKRFLFTVTINELSLRELNLRFTVKRVEPVPADTSNFVPVNEQISQLQNVESHGKYPVVLTETGLTPHAKNLKITMSDQKSQIAHSSTSATTVPSPRPKRKIDFQHADDFVMIDQIKETQDDATDLR